MDRWIDRWIDGWMDVFWEVFKNSYCLANMNYHIQLSAITYNSLNFRYSLANIFLLQNESIKNLL